MNLTTLLAELRENILHDRSDRVSGQSDRLWSDETLVRYINEAQKKFARQSYALRDATTAAVCEVTLATDTATYSLHPSILHVISGQLTGDTGDMIRTGHDALSVYRTVVDDRVFDVNAFPATVTGKPLAFSTDEAFAVTSGVSSKVQLRVYPTPSSDYNNVKINLRVIRLPLVDFTTTSTDTQFPEIPDQYHMDMLDWAAYLSLRIADDEAGDQKLAERYASTFEANTKKAMHDALKQMFAPRRWGFGRAGFAWEH